MSTEANVAQKVARAELMKRVLIVITAILVTANQVTMLIVLARVSNVVEEVRATQQKGSPTLLAIQEQQDDIEEAADASVSTNELLLGCFQPDSQCSKRTEAREAERAGAYNAAVIAAQFCVDRRLPATYTHRELSVCVGKILDGRGY